MRNLYDPDLPPGEIVEKRDDDVWVRNDGIELLSAEKNPYYVLATVYGDYENGYNENLATKNRRIWNGWVGSFLEPSERAEIVRKMELEAGALDPLNSEELDLLKSEFHRRLPYTTELPEPGFFNFSRTYFRHTIVLEKFVFAGTAAFSFSYFVGIAGFSSAHFFGDAWLSFAHFAGPSNFASAKFDSYAWFRGARFVGQSTFSLAHFVGDANFSSAEYIDHVDFSETHFDSLVDFSFAQFESPIDFKSSHFDRSTKFSSAHFESTVEFSSVEFKNSADYSSAHFSNSAEFSFTLFARHANFISARFDGVADFSDGTFAGVTDFSNACFTSRVPNFFQRELHDDTKFTARASHWPRTPIVRQDAQKSKDAYRRLRQISATQLHPENEHFFLRQEMNCDIALKEDWLGRWVIKLFGLVSSFGISIGRPGSALLALWLVPSFFYAALFKSGWVMPVWSSYASAYVSGWGTAMGFSFSNLFAFFGLSGRHFGEVWQDAPSWVHFLGGAQTVFGFIFLFFLGLGLRNRFRLK